MLQHFVDCSTRFSLTLLLSCSNGLKLKWLSVHSSSHENSIVYNKNWRPAPCQRHWARHGRRPMRHRCCQNARDRSRPDTAARGRSTLAQVVTGRGPAAAPPPARRALAPDQARARAPRPASLTLSPGWIQGQGPLAGPAGAKTAPMRLGDSEFPDHGGRRPRRIRNSR